MNPSCLQYGLTEDERQRFDETGLLVVEDALSPDQIAALTAATDGVYAAKAAQGHDPHTALFYPNFLPDDDLFLNLVDHEKILP